jgi:uncharacterized protein (TIGR02186 family)
MRPAPFRFSLRLLRVAAALLPPAAGRAQTLSADLSSHLVAITTGFTGTSVVLFGATDGPADVIAVVRGPETGVTVRRKSRIAGLWINTREVTFTGVPSFYAVYSTRPLDEIAPPRTQGLHQIGVDSLRFAGGEEARDPAERDAFRAALLDEQRRQRLYVDEPGRIAFLGDRLFRATFDFPANVPTGTYIVEVFLVRDKSVVNGQTTPLLVSQTGIDADVGEFAQRQALAYGVLAVVVAALAGWLASLPFRNA